MNIAACVPSQSAPDDWTKNMSADAIRAEILEQDPDIIALQECPGGVVWAGEVFPSYRPIGATYSHADEVVLLVRRGISAKLVSAPDVDYSIQESLPAIVAELEWNDRRRMLMASVHLEPFDQGEAKRRRQMEALVRMASSKDIPLIVAGDTNMRDREDATMESTIARPSLTPFATASRRTTERCSRSMVVSRMGTPRITILCFVPSPSAS